MSTRPSIQTCRNCNRNVVAGLDFCSLCLLTPVINSSPRDFAQSSSLTGKRINGYCIEEIIGMGGFADVYSARREVNEPNIASHAATDILDRRSNTTFAIKVLRKGISSPEMIARFEVERRLLEQFTNEGIVRVFESGLADDNRPYFVMEQINGLPITEFCDAEQFSLSQRLELFAKVCDAVYHAHSKGIIHRDLKPSNVLVHLDQGVAQAKVIDFGIAKAIETPDWQSMPVTQVNVVMGTPAYISPEQADGSGNADMRSDIYSLGVLLYEVITDQSPWSHEQWRHLPSVQWSRFLRENTPPAPSDVLMQQANKVAVAKRVQGDVDQIIRKAMSANPSDRYSSALGLANDIRRWLAGQPVTARPLSQFEQLKRFVNCHRWQAATVLASLVGILCIAILGTVLSITMRKSNSVLLIERNRAVELEREASVARTEAVSEKKLAEHQRYASEIRLSEVYLQNEEPFLAADRLRRTQADLRGWEYNYLTGLSKRYQSACDFDLTDANRLGSDSAGKWIAVASKSRWQLANLDANQKLDVINEQEKVEKIAVQANDNRVYVAVLTDGPSKAVIRVYAAEITQETGRVSPMKFAWETSVTADGCWIQWHQDQNGIYLLTVYGNGQEPSPSRILAFDAASGTTIKDRNYERFKIDGKGIECKPNFPWILVRRSFSSFDVMSWPELNLAKTVDLQTNSMIGDMLIDAKGKQILFAQMNRVFEIQISDDGQISEPAMLSQGLSNELIYRLNLMPSSKGNVSSNDKDQGSSWVAIGDRSQVIEGDASVRPLMTKQEISQVSLNDGSYASLLSEGRVEVRSDVPAAIPVTPTEAATTADPSAEGAVQLSEGRRVCVAPDSTFCVFQEWHPRAARRDRTECTAPTPVAHGCAAAGGNSCP